MLTRVVLPTGNDFDPMPTPYIDERVDIVENGVKVSKMQKKTHKWPYDGFKARDFQIQEILESGATDLLIPTSPIAPSKLAALDAAAVSSDQLEMSFSESQKTVQETVTSESSSEA